LVTISYNKNGEIKTAGKKKKGVKLC